MKESTSSISPGWRQNLILVETVDHQYFLVGGAKTRAEAEEAVKKRKGGEPMSVIALNVQAFLVSPLTAASLEKRYFLKRL